MKYELNQIVKTKKPHVCGSNEWKVVRTGADIKLECQGCGRIIMLQGFELDKRIKDFADWTDAGSTRVEYLEPDGKFAHGHPYAFNLEYAELPEDKDNPYNNALEIASELLRGTNSSIECLQWYCEKYSHSTRP